MIVLPRPHAAAASAVYTPGPGTLDRPPHPVAPAHATVVRASRLYTVTSGDSISAVAVVMNELFVRQFLGAQYFGDPLLSFLLVLHGGVQCLYRIETAMMDGARAFKERALIGLLAGLVGLFLGWVLCPSLGGSGASSANGPRSTSR